MSNMGFLFMAYSLIWAFVFGFVFYLHRKQRRLRREIDSLKGAGDSVGNRRLYPTLPDYQDVNTD